MNRFLIFDAYGTLVELDDFYGRLQRGFAQNGAELPDDVVKKAAHCEMRHYISRARFAACLDTWNAIRRECAEVLAASIREQGHKLELSSEATTEILTNSIHFRAFPHARATLENLKTRGWGLGVLSNWDWKLPDALEEAGLGGFFDFILTSAQVGIEKPARSFFQKGFALAQKIRPNLAPNDCFYVGDHYEKDVLGARNAGLTPLWLVRDARDLASGETHEADDDVPRLNSLHDLLKIF